MGNLLHAVKTPCLGAVTLLGFDKTRARIQMATLDEIQRAEVTELSVRQRVEAFYKGTDAIRHFAEEVMIPVLRGQLNLNDNERAITGTYYRMYLYIQSLVALNSRIHFQSAASASRSLFELLLDLKLLATDSRGTMTAMFHAFPKLERFRAAKHIVEYNDMHDDSGIDDIHQRNFVNTPGKEQEIDALTLKYWGKDRSGKLRRPMHWSGLDVKARAVKLGQAYEELYLASYPFMNWSVHAGSGNYTGLDEGAIESSFGLSHSISQRCFLEATNITAGVMRISKAVESFADILEELRLAPGIVIVEAQARKIDEARSASKNQRKT